MTESSVRSPHPVDRLIRELLATGRAATPDEVASIVARLASAPFNPGDIRVRRPLRGTTYLGQTLGARADSLVYHLAKAVIVDDEWAAGTTAGQYVADLRRAVLAPTARLGIYERQAGHLAAAIAPTEQIIPPERRGARWERLLLVLYSADRGIIISGYQIPALATANIPPGVRWLK